MSEPTKIRVQLFRMFIGALFGVAVSFVAAKSGFLDWVRTMPGEDVAATALASAMLLLGVFALVTSASPGMYRRIAANYREGDPLDGQVLRQLRLSAVALLISAAVLAAPPFAVRLGADVGVAKAIAAAIGILLLASCWLAWRIMRNSDELTRSLSAESSAISFWVLSTGLFGWAVLAKLGLAQDASLWTLMILTMTGNLVVQIGLSIRRGLFA
jgi:hypothetical protein